MVAKRTTPRMTPAAGRGRPAAGASVDLRPGRLGQGPAGEHLREVALVVGRRVEVGRRLGALGRLGGGTRDRRLVERAAAQRVLDGARPQGDVAHVREADAIVLARAVRALLDGRAL